jgi:small subunit ribosomal protein S20
MPNHKSAVERVRRNERDNDKNRHYKSLLKETTKAVTSAKTKAEAQENYKKLASLLDKMVIKGILHKNNSANRKSSMSKRIQGMA